MLRRTRTCSGGDTAGARCNGETRIGGGSDGSAVVMGKDVSCVFVRVEFLSVRESVYGEARMYYEISGEVIRGELYCSGICLCD